MADHSRVQAFLTKMKDLDLDYLVAYFDGIHSFLEPNLVFLLTGFKSIGESMVLLQSDGVTTLITTPSWDAERAKTNSNVSTVLPTDDLVNTFKGLMELAKAGPDKIGFIGLKSIRQSSYSELSSYFKNQLNLLDEHFVDLTACKTESELIKARKATWIAERGYEKMLEIAKPGMYDYQLAGEIESFMKSLGADDNFFLMSASSHNHAVRPPGRRRLEPGDIILAEISPSYEGQFTQICRSVVLGDQNRDQLLESYNLLVTALERGIAVAKPGEKLSNVVRAINEPLEEAGYAQYCRPPYMRVRGHGLGLSSFQPGDVSEANHTVLQEGMFFVIHPNQYIPETGYLLCGEPVLITSTGSQVLTKRKPSLDIIAV